MGTRHLTCVVANGEYKVAQYGQWDGYPEGQGVTVLEFLHHNDLAKFKDIVTNRVTSLTDEEVNARWVACGADGSGWAGMDVAQRFKMDNLTLSRDTGAKVLKVLMDNGGGDIYNSLDFAADSLFCEYAYVVDLDKNTFEVYEGFNKSPLDENERFYFLSEKADAGYHPVSHLVTWKLNELPSTEEFCEITHRLLGNDR